MAKIFWTQSDQYPGGATCQVAVEGSRLLATPVDGEAISFDLQRCQVSVAGMNSSQLVLEGPEHALYLERSQWEDQLRSLGFAHFNRRLMSEQGRARWRDRRWSLILLGAAAALLMSLLALIGVSDILIEQAVARTPVQWEIELGKLLAQGFESSHRPLQLSHRPQLDSLFSELTAPYPQYPWKLVVMDDPQENAMALPGGTVFVCAGLLKSASGSDELAGVLAHEIHHVVYRHGLHGLYSQIRWQLPMTLLVGDEKSTRALVFRQAGQLASLSYSRSMEAQADEGGFNLLVSLRIDPHGLVNFFQRSAAKEGMTDQVLNYRSTHPTSHSRQQRLNQRLAGQSPTQWRKLSLDWENLRKELP